MNQTGGLDVWDPDEPSLAGGAGAEHPLLARLHHLEFACELVARIGGAPLLADTYGESWHKDRPAAAVASVLHDRPPRAILVCVHVSILSDLPPFSWWCDNILTCTHTSIARGGRTWS